MDRRITRTKRNIREAFFKLLAKKNLDDITVTELAKAADIDRRTFYLHYDTVQDVLLEVEGETYEALLSILENMEIFSLLDFLNQLSPTIQKNLPLITLMATDRSLAYLKNDCGRMLSRAIYEVYLASEGGDEKRKRYLADYIGFGITAVTFRWLMEDQDSIPVQEAGAYWARAIEESMVFLNQENQKDQGK